ncbi:MAG TPA: SRPBCC domain-containing protein, partial [Jiangellaceae bacterium]|nr:SRPBCC domain-containing protein [Jiangellaceae bacterium]
EITLTPIPGGTRVSVEHRDLPPDDAAQHAAGWPHFLARLSVAARGDDPGPDPFATATTGNG